MIGMASGELRAGGQVFPHIALGGAGLEYQIEVQISVRTGGLGSSRPWEGQVGIYGTWGQLYWPGVWSADGDPREGFSHVTVDEIPHGGSRVIILTGDDEVRTGFLTVSSEGPGGLPAVSVFLRLYKDGVLIDTVGLIPSYGRLDTGDAYTIPVRRREGEFDTGIACVLLSEERGFDHAYAVIMELYDDQGRRIQGKRLVSAPEDRTTTHFHSARFISEVFPQVFPQVLEHADFVGSVKVYSPFELGVVVMGLRIDYVSNGV